MGMRTGTAEIELDISEILSEEIANRSITSLSQKSGAHNHKNTMNKLAIFHIIAFFLSLYKQP